MHAGSSPQAFHTFFDKIYKNRMFLLSQIHGRSRNIRTLQKDPDQTARPDSNSIWWSADMDVTRKDQNRLSFKGQGQDPAQETLVPMYVYTFIS
jgi:hypothetical protein